MKGLSFLSTNGWSSSILAPHASEDKKQSVKPSIISKKIKVESSNSNSITSIQKNFSSIAYSVISDPEKNCKQLLSLSAHLKGKYRQVAWATLVAVFSKINIEKISNVDFEKFSNEKKEFVEYQQFIAKLYMALIKILQKKTISTKEKPHIKMQAVQCLCELLKMRNHLSRSFSSISFVVALAFSKSSFIHSQACLCIHYLLSDESESKEIQLFLLRSIYSQIKKNVNFPHLSNIIDSLQGVIFNTIHSNSDITDTNSYRKVDKTHMSGFSRRVDRTRRKLNSAQDLYKKCGASQRAIKLNADYKSMILFIYNLAVKSKPNDLTLLLSILKNLCKHSFIINVSYFVDLSTNLRNGIANCSDNSLVLRTLDAYIDLYISMDSSRSTGVLFIVCELNKRIDNLDITIATSLLKKIVDNRLLTFKDILAVFGRTRQSEKMLRIVFAENYNSANTNGYADEIPALLPNLSIINAE